MPGITAILQARMGSTRLPGKVLREVLGRPLLAFELERLQQCRSLERVVLATSESPADAAVAALGQSLGVEVFRGSEADVLDRYHRAAERSGAAHVMRVTGDCPLLDPGVCDAVAAFYFESGADYVQTPPALAEGLDCEIFSATALAEAWRLADKPSEREHVTLYLRNHPERFRLAVWPHPEDESRYRITVDEPEDFEVVRRILEALVPEFGPVFPFARVREFLDGHPEVFGLNSQVVRNAGLAKSLAEERQ